MTWYAVQCVLKRQEPEVYRESITLWCVSDWTHAFDAAENAARQTSPRGDTYVGYAHAYATDIDEQGPSSGDEVFSFLRSSHLSDADYLEHFYGAAAYRCENQFVRPATKDDDLRGLNAYTVKAIIRADSDNTFEERMTFWHAADTAEAMSLASQEASSYAEEIFEGRLLGIVSCCLLDEFSPQSGTEIFTASRHSSQDTDTFVKHFYDTGDKFATDFESGQ